MFIPAIETKSRKEIEAYQLERLRDSLQYVSQHSAYYQRVFGEHGIAVDQVRSLQDLARLPVTTKKDIQAYHEDFICVDRSKIIDYACTSGTTGKPLVIPQTDADLDRLAYNEFISLSCAGITPDDLVMVCTTMDKQFMAGMAYFLGLRKLGAGIIRTGVDSIPMQWHNILTYQPNVLIAVPSFIVKMIDYAKANHIDLRRTSVKKIVCIGEGIRNFGFYNNSLSKRIEKDWPVQLHSTYAATEMAAAFTECDAQKGGHHHPELVVIECLDQNNRPLPPGQVGELTITTLGVEAFPLVRYKTGDLVALYTTTCSCGRTSSRVSPLIGRTQQRLKVKGTTIYPPAIIDILNQDQSLKDYLILIKKDVLGSDEIEILVDAKKGTKGCADLKQQLRSFLRVSPKLLQENVQAKRIELGISKKRKPVKLLDLRTSALLAPALPI